MRSPLLDDPFALAQIERALEPFIDRIDADELAWMRQELARILVEDEHARALLMGAHPRDVESSGEQVRLTELLRRAEKMLDDERSAGAG
jgi:hypothetical protein